MTDHPPLRPGDEMDNPFWHHQRIDEDSGDIRYEAHGPHHSFVVFRGPKVKDLCEKFIDTMNTPAPWEKK